jgi:hypothetical protein
MIEYRTCLCLHYYYQDSSSYITIIYSLLHSSRHTSRFLMRSRITNYFGSPWRLLSEARGPSLRLIFNMVLFPGDDSIALVAVNVL